MRVEVSNRIYVYVDDHQAPGQRAAQVVVQDGERHDWITVQPDEVAALAAALRKVIRSE